MKKHMKKMIAPIVIAAVFLIYLGIYAAILTNIPEFHPAVILMTIPLVLLGAGMLYALFTRIREIRSGEEDDLDNY